MRIAAAILSLATPAMAETHLAELRQGILSCDSAACIGEGPAAPSAIVGAARPPTPPGVLSAVRSAAVASSGNKERALCPSWLTRFESAPRS